MPDYLDTIISYICQNTFDDLPQAAQAYLHKLEELCETPIAIVSTGPDRAETMILKHPFE